MIRAVLLLTLLLCGCARKSHIPVADRPVAERPVASETVETPRDWIDLQAGWRIRVITPILASGGFEVKSTTVAGPADAAGEDHGPLTVSMGSDFLGYEASYYSVTERGGGGVSVTYQSADKILNGREAVPSKPLVPMFGMPSDARYVRVLHMTRLSHSDHEQTILAESDLVKLEDLTKRILADPAACGATQQADCFGVPPGIAVIPERNSGTDKAPKWVPAQ